jgi:hypothetical protein
VSVERAHCRARDDGRRVDILGKEVTSNGLLITLLNKVGYDDLARGLKAYADKQVRAEA